MSCNMTNPVTKDLRFIKWLTGCIILSLLLISCSKEPPYLYKVTGLSLENRNNSGAVNPAPDSIPGKAYGIRINYTTEIYNTDKTIKHESGFEIGIKATYFNIYSFTAFDSNHPALSSLNDYFLYDGDTIQHRLQYGTLFSRSGSFSGDINVGVTSSSYGELALMVPPAIPGYRRFVVEVGFSDNTYKADTIGAILY